MIEDIEDIVSSFEVLLEDYHMRKGPKIPEGGSGEIIFTLGGRESPYDPKIVSGFLNDLEKALPIFKRMAIEKYGARLSTSSAPIFPKKWMRKDKTIAANLTRCKWLCPLLNFIFEKTRSYALHGEEMKKLTDGHLIAGKHQATAFLTNCEFWDEITKKVKLSIDEKVKHISKPTARKYFQAFAKNGLIQLLRDCGPKGKIYLDGYYLHNEGKPPRKLSLLKKDKDFLEALRNFQIRT